MSYTQLIDRQIIGIVLWLACVLCSSAQSTEKRAMRSSVSKITPEIEARIEGKSYPAGARISIDDLRYITIEHYTPTGEVAVGELIVNKSVSHEVIAIFSELYDAHYPIERVRLIDDYGADDEQSMRHNNSSAFCYRTIAGSTKLSKHSLGLAIDINPLYNPYFKVDRNGRGDSIGYHGLQPSTAGDYVDRSREFDMRITPDDTLVRVFKRHGWKWGGDWKSVRDYQHFEK